MKSSKEIKKIARECIVNEYDAVAQLPGRINDDFVKVIRLLQNIKGRIIVVAIGKSANIANKLVATFNSIGQPSLFLHAAEAIHGDLGIIQSDDVVICISKSGNTPEIKALLPLIIKMKNTLIAMTGNLESYLSDVSDYVIDVSVNKEACPNNLAPTTSTTVQLVMSDALAVTLLACKNFSGSDFARFHPGGTLGKRLTIKLSDLLYKDSDPKVDQNDLINKVILEISNKRLGATAVLEKGNLKGIITDGDLRRMLEDNKENFSNVTARSIMTLNPKTMDVNDLAYEGLIFMQNNNISQLILLKKKKYVGMIHIHEIIKAGIV